MVRRMHPSFRKRLSLLTHLQGSAQCARPFHESFLQQSAVHFVHMSLYWSQHASGLQLYPTLRWHPWHHRRNIDEWLRHSWHSFAVDMRQIKSLRDSSASHSRQVFLSSPLLFPWSLWRCISHASHGLRVLTLRSNQAQINPLLDGA